MSGRYSRQERFMPIGAKGQQTLSEAHVLMIGAGALGASTAEMMARAGVGTISIIDRDYVDLSNLQRQQLYDESDVTQQMPKAEAAKQRLHQINSGVTVHAYIGDADAAFFERILSEESIDLMFDGTDNFDIRFIMNDASQKYNVPWLYGACVGAQSLSFFIRPGKTPCLHCLMGGIPSSGPTCDTVGIIAPASQMTASLQAAEALKYLTGNEQALRNAVFSIDLWNNTFSNMNVNSMKKADCPSCGEVPTYPFLAYEAATKFAVLCGRNTVQIRPQNGKTRDLDKLKNQIINRATMMKKNDFLLSFTCEPFQITAFRDGRVFIHGSSSIEESKKIYYQYFT